MKIGIILGSIREGRQGEAVGAWVKQAAAATNAEAFELIDLRDHKLPLFDGPKSPNTLNKQYDTPEVQKWSSTIDACDAFIFVTPEYNWSYPGAFKNAIDSIGPEWRGKPIGFVGYGYSNKGAKAVEAWKHTLAVFQMQFVEPTVLLSLAEDIADGSVAPQESTQASLDSLLVAIQAATKSEN